MVNKLNWLLVLFFLVLQSYAQCESYGTIVISEVYFDTHYTEDITSRYHSFGEYIEIYNSSNQSIDLTDWVIKDNHTEFKFTVNEYNANLIIEPGGFKVITYNGFWAYPTTNAGLPSSIGGRDKFKELFPQATGHDGDIILQNTMVLYNFTDKVSLYNDRGRLIDEVSYSNNPNYNPVINPELYMNIDSFTYVVNPVIFNQDGGVFIGQMGLAPTYSPTGQPLLDSQGNPLISIHNDYLQAIYRSQIDNFYVDGGKVFKNAVTTPFSIPFSVPLKDPDPRLSLADESDENSTEEILYDTFTGAIIAQSRTYYDQLGRARVSLSTDFETDVTWGSETTYDVFGRQSSTSFPAITCFGLEKVNFLTEQSAYTNFLEKYYSNNNDYEPYQAIATQPYSVINYDKLNPGKVINVVGGNKVNGEWKTGYSFTVPAAQEMYYVYGYNYYEGVIENGKEEIITKFYKTVNIDANGEETVAFSDGEGKVLATARTGGATYPVHSLIAEQGYVDVHIPKGITSAQITLIGGAGLYDIYDLKTGLLYTGSLSGGNAYRVKLKLLPLLLIEPKVYVTNATSGILSFDTGARGISYLVNYYDYSVNIYNKVGQLVKHVEPLGYQSNTTIKAIPSHMATNATNFISTYSYNALGQVFESNGFDEGVSKFIYRKDGQIRYSQSALQNNTKVSYTDYDAFARPIESGVIANTWANASANPDGVLLSGSRTDQIFSIYDYAENFTMSPLVQFPNNQTLVNLLGANSVYYVQKNLSGNIALSFKKNGATFPAITWYSYDIYGRIEWMVQYIEGIGVKTIDYEYDYKGNVNKVLYQKHNSTELFVHRYSYDLNGVLKRVETSTNNIAFSTHADYSYYLTGELKRVNIAKGLQGLDYVYTLGGNLKSINHPSLDIAQDPGHDSNDLFGITLDYYSGDYVRQNTNITASPSVSGYNKDQYTGNIKATRWATKHSNMDFIGGTVNQKAYLYNYDKNNWLTNATFGTASNSAFVHPSSNYTEGGITFDANGNIRTLNRTNNSGLLVDRLTYNYSGNRLNHIRENAAPTADLTDIENQNVDNYQYDALGQLRRNNLEKLEYNYNVQGLTTSVINLNNNRPLVAFEYNERGQRVKKQSFNTLTGALLSTDYYLLDLAGNVMSIYTKPNDSNPLAQKELPIYGLKRLGVYFKSNGASNYELTDHLGNVRAVIQKTAQNPFVQMLAYSDYYPFGEKLPTRNSSSNYRYAFQGQELDGETNMEAFQLRLWDGRIGRWLSPDPYGMDASPYIGMANNPISTIDPDGGCPCSQCPENCQGSGVNPSTDADDMYPLTSGMQYLDDVVIGTGNASGFSDDSLWRYTPGFGSGLDAYDAFARGDYWTGAFHSALAFSDVATLGAGSLVKGGLKATIKFGAKELAEEGVEQGAKKFWKKSVNFKNTKVFQRDDLIDVALTDARGRTNLQRMQKGLAPIGPDGKSLNLHHMLQSADGSIAEVTQTFHKKNHKIIHINPNTIPSGIDRVSFDKFRSGYWINRASNF